MKATDRAPLQKVVKIDYVDGDRGGRSWFLTLECGHFKSARIPKFRVERIEQYSKTPSPPERCRCSFCAAADPLGARPAERSAS